jgi:hypothetical protein
LLIGANLQDHTLSIPDPTNPVQGSKLGLKVHGDVWGTPTPATMVYAFAEYSTAFATFHVSAKGGIEIISGQQLYLGPQLSFFGNERFRQWRAGGHLTGLQLGRLDIDIGGGYLRETDEGNGVYGTIEAKIRF